MKILKALPHGAHSERVALVSGRKWTAAEIQSVAHINGDTLTNYLSKNNLRLASSSDGPGKPRAFCTVDAYQLSLMQTLTGLTKRAGWAARIVEIMLFEHAINQAYREVLWVGSDSIANTLPAAAKVGGNFADLDTNKKSARIIKSAAQSFCKSLENCPKIYTYRNTDVPYVVYFDHDLFSSKEQVFDYTLRLGTAPFNPTRYDPTQDIAPVAGLFVNLTWLFSMVDRSLERILIEKSNGAAK
jgi:hypothetical protein